MGFFKEFKDDFSQAVNELMPGDDNIPKEEGLDGDDMVVNTLDDEMDTESELSKLNGLLEHVAEKPVSQAVVKQQQVAELEKEFMNEVSQEKPEAKPEPAPAAKPEVKKAAPEKEAVKEIVKEEPVVEETKVMEEKKAMNEETMTVAAEEQQVPGVDPNAISDETTVITEGTNIKGDINSNGSVDVRGRIGGNVTCNGKLTITGVLEGNSNSSEFFADAAKVEGEVNSTGTVKIGIGSVVIGNITAASAVIAGAIKGDIDVQGPVVVDTSAVVMGNIKSRSVQINNGAVIEGFCSQCYADIDVQGLFDEKKGL